MNATEADRTVARTDCGTIATPAPDATQATIAW